MSHSSDLNETSPISRRGILQSSVAAGLTLALSSNGNPIMADETKPAVEEKPEPSTTILFQGDSITDVGRDRKRKTANDARSLGRGYPLLVASGLLSESPAGGYKIHNRGISGNKVPDLKKRWQADCLDIKPDVLSILIGVNDIWHKLNGRYDGTVETYETGFHDLLIETQAALPKTRIVICEPFVLKCGAVNDKWFPEFDQRREVANQLASDLGFTLVPFQSMFNKALDQAPPQYWAGDGVHPTLAGHALMAKTWREVVGV